MVCPFTPTTSPIWRGDKKPAFTLAEGATHVDMFHDIRKSAFTLAEVLVTLGIIGVVAAMTLPMLAKNYQRYVLLQQFKKAYATIAIVSQKTQIDMGEGVRCSYVGNAIPDGSALDCNYFYSEFVKNLQIIKICDGNALEGKCIPKDMRGGEKVFAEVQGGTHKEEAKELFTKLCRGFTTEVLQTDASVYVVNSGFIMIPYRWGATSSLFHVFIIDVNGHKGPNKWGYDIHVLSFDRRKQSDSVFNVIGSSHCLALDEGGTYTTEILNYVYGTHNRYEDLLPK